MWHICIGNKCWTNQMAKWCKGWRRSLERINRACRRCNKNLLHLALACSKGLPSVSYWKGSHQFGGVRMKREMQESTDHSDILWQQVISQESVDGWMHACRAFNSCLKESTNQSVIRENIQSWIQLICILVFFVVVVALSVLLYGNWNILQFNLRNLSVFLSLLKVDYGISVW